MTGGVIDLVAEPAQGIEPASAMRVVRIEGFEAPVVLDEGSRDAYRRRFVTLFADDASARRGGMGRVTRVTNVQGETFALKTLLVPGREEWESEEDCARRADMLARAFRQEYECHRELSGFRGLPRLYGYGTVDGVPAMVMEWIDGVTLADAAALLAVDGAGRVSPLAVARIGRELFDLLARMGMVGDGFAHRDISPANIMLRTSHLSVLEQADEGAFDLCLIDFGSASPAVVQGTSFTQAHAVARRATADYAPPEMLTDDIPGIDALRKSPAIDVYAAGSVLYELLCGRVPFTLAPDGGAGEGEEARSPYRVKAEQAPKPPVAAHGPQCVLADVLLREPEVAVAAERAFAALAGRPDEEEVRDALEFVDDQLAEVVMACLAADQKARPKAGEVRDAFVSFSLRYAENVERSLAGDPLIPCALDGAWRGSATSPFAQRNFVRVVGKSASAAIWLAVVAITALLANGLQAGYHLGPIAWEGALPGWAVAAALAAPAVAAQLGAWGGARTKAGFVRGTAALVLAAALVAVLASGLSLEAVGKVNGLFAALFAAVAAGWCPVVVDYALTVVPLLGGGRRRLPAPAAGADQALPGAGPAPLPGAAGAGSAVCPAPSKTVYEEELR